MLSTYPSSKYNFLSVLGTAECHHVQSCASEANFFPDEVWMRVESFRLGLATGILIKNDVDHLRSQRLLLFVSL